jgi:hypothetical protein
VYNLITGELPPGARTIWREYISSPENYEVALIKDIREGELSQVEEDLIDEIFFEFGTKSRWELVDYTHRLPEWQDPNGSSIPIAPRDILKAEHRTDAEIESFEAELESLAVAQALVSPQ